MTEQRIHLFANGTQYEVRRKQELEALQAWNEWAR